MLGRHDASTLIELLHLRASEDPDRRAYTFLLDGEAEEGHLTYGELERRARAVGGRLQALNAAGERALLLYPPGPEYIVALFGCFYAGVIAVPAYPPRRNRVDPRLQALAADCLPALALTTRELLGEADRMCGISPELAGLRWMATEDVPPEEAERWRDPGVSGDTLAFLQYTSGSTASPKGVMISHGNLLHNFAVIEGFTGYTPETRSVIWLPPYHDMGLIGGILQPLFTGYWAALFSPVAFIQRPARWLEAISRYRATSSGGPNFAYDLCVHAVRPEEREALDLSHWEIAFNGAEPVRHETLRAFAEAFAPSGFRARAFYPCYGLAEATLMVTGSRADEPPAEAAVDPVALGEGVVREAEPEGRYRLVGSGRSAPLQRVRIVDPATLRECPPDRVGEVWVSGPSVARGYWGRPAETAETFAGYEASTGAGPFLRTGDLGFLADGELFVTGRLKDLIIIRGRNHYPQDIEQSALRSYEGLRAGSGAAFSVEQGGEERLVVVQEVSRQAALPDVEEVAAAIRGAVASEHGLQVHAVAVVRPGGVPRTTSGKVQRRACRMRFLAGELPLVGLSVREEASPAPRPAGVGITREALEAVAADGRQALVEALLVERAARALGTDPAAVDREHPLVALGLDSLRAMELKGSLEAALEVPVPISSLLDGATIEQLAAELVREVFVSRAAAPAGAGAAEGGAPLSFAQERLWFLDRLHPGSAAYNIPFALRVRGPLDADALRRSLGEIVRRHNTLRTVFAGADGRLVQVVRPAGKWTLPVEDVSGLPAGERAPAARRAAEAEAAAPFDLAAGPLLRTRLVRLADDEHLLVVVMHHAVSDGWSVGVVLRELAALYPPMLAGASSPLPPLPTQYADWAVRQREALCGEALQAQLAYWRGRLAGATPLDLPTDRPRPAVQSLRGATHRFEIPAEVVEGARALAREEGATPFMALLAAWDLLLARHAGGEDVAVGTPLANRDRPEVAGLVGPFVDTLVLRVEVAPEEGFRVLLLRTRAAALEAFARADLPFERLVAEVQPERDLSRPPLFQVMLAPQNTALEPVEIPGATLVPEPVETGTSIVDLTLFTWQRSGGGLAAALEYATDLFDGATVERMAAHLVQLLRAAAAAPDLAVAELPLLPPEERARVLEEWNATGRPYPERCLHELFAEQAARTPGAAALRFRGRTVTYAELERDAGRLARHLRALGVGPEARVGICLERTPEMVAAMLGVLGAGAAYLPLDPAYPAERLGYMLADAGAAVVVSQSGLAERLPDGVPRLLLDADAERIAARPDTIPAGGVEPGNLAYVLYTSGSTGRPKGVQVEHRSASQIVHFLRDAVREEDRAAVLGSTSISFDVSVGEIFGTICWGGTLVLVENALDLPRVADEGVRLVVTVPSAAAELLRTGGIPESVRAFNLAGEALPASLARDLYALPGTERVLNLYGPTEDTVYSTWSEVDRGAERVGIGRPVANSRAYVLDPAGSPAPVGVAGELCLGGAGTARGYHARPGLTAEAFVPDPFSPAPGARLYRTGDRARWLAEGGLEYLGRIDQQVKVRGFRVEPGEVEAALRAHPGVGEAAVAVREDTSGQLQLTGYYVARDGDAPAAAELREFLRARLPEHMVPGAIVALSALPTTPSGKLDRRALPAPETAASGGERVPPRTRVEAELAEVFAAVLGREAVGIHDGFFQLGGHSLLATRVVSRVRELWSLELPLRALFEAPTVAALAGRVEAALGGERGALARIPRRAGDGPAPLSFAQQRLWFIHRLDPGSSAYNMPLALRLRGALDVAALRRGLGELARRHEAVRTVLAERGGEVVQTVLRAGPAPVPVLDVAGLPDDARRAEALRRVAEEGRRPFDLQRGPLLRVLLARLAGGEWVLLLTMHHAVSDGWSMGVLVRELSTLYGAFTRGEASPLPEPELQYADFAVWQREWLTGYVLDAQLRYWREKLEDAPPLLELPADFPRRSALGATEAGTPFELSPEAAQGLHRLARLGSSTVFMTLLAGWQALLGRYSGQDDLLVGSPIANRTRAELEGVVGCFVNTLVLRGDLRGDPSFRELLGRVRETTLGAFAHQDLPFERLVEEMAPERSLMHNPLFQVLFVLQNVEAGPPTLGGLEMEPLGRPEAGAKFDLVVTFFEDGERIRGQIDYRTDLFEASTVERMAEHFRLLLDAAVADPGRRIGALPLLRPAERAALVARWSGTGAAPLPESCVHELFAAQAARTPHAAAVVDAGRTLTYAELDARADRLAHALAGLGVRPEVPVALCLERSAETVAAVLGILKAGGAYVPLDPSYPAERLACILADSGAPVLVTRERHRALLAGGGTRVLCLDRDAALFDGRPEGAPPGDVAPGVLAYVVYTSGSTGRPKGVAVEHRAVAAHLAAFARALEIGPADRVLHFASFGFDVSIEQLFLPLVSGAALVLRGPEPWPPEEWPARVREAGVTVANLPPAYWQEVADAAAGSALPGLRLLLVGADAMPSAAVRRWRDAVRSPARLLNAYGPTEAVITAAAFALPADYPTGRVGVTVPIGRPLPWRAAFVLDRLGEPVPVGLPGELHLGGAQLARGYLGSPELTAERFAPDPFSTQAGARLYRTGDRVRWLASGELEYLGRLDEQVKIRGFRIEPGEVEAVLAGHPGIREAAVVVRDAPSGEPADRRLVAYVVPRREAAGGTPGADPGRRIQPEPGAWLRERLPEYMVPGALVVLDALPLTPGGKVDRRALPAPEPAAPDESYRAPRSAVEEVLAGIWAEVLGLERVGAEQSFFELGGHSLLATQVVSRARQAFGVEVPLRMLFEMPSLAALAGCVEELRSTGAPPAPPIERVPREGTGGLPLSFAQQRLWVMDRLDPGSAAYNMSGALRLRGRLSPDALRASLDALARRHEVLRTVFEERDGSPVQVVHPPARLPSPVVDLERLPSGARREEAERLVREEALRPFDLARGPLLRSTLLRLGEADQVLCFTMHHIVSDGWSMEVLVAEVSALYAAFGRGEEPALPELPVQYADYAVWQRGWLRDGVLEAQLGYWKRCLAGMPPLLEVATDRPRSVEQGARAGRHRFALSSRVSDALRELSRREGTTLFMTLLAGWQALLGRYAGQEDVVVGTPVAGRTRRETEGLIGFFVNMLALRGDLGGDPTWRELLGRVRDVALGAYEHQELPFERLVEELGVERSLTHSPVFQAAFALQRFGGHGRLSLGETELEPFDGGAGAARFDLDLTLLDEEPAIPATLEYRESLFEAETVARMAAHLEVVLEAMAADPRRRLSELSLLHGAERAQVLEAWNATAADFPRVCVHDLVAEQAAGTPDSVAVVHGGERLTYAELERAANRLAHHLAGMGVGPEVRVGVCMERGPEMVVALLGVLRAGGAYVPLDPSYPPDRLAHVLADAEVPVLVTEERVSGRVPSFGGARVCVDREREAIAGRPCEPPPARTTAQNAAYVIYTSGSTGRPKGIVVPHRGIVSFLHSMRLRPGLAAGDTLLAVTTISFDIAALEVFLPLTTGARVVVADRETASDPARLREAIAASGATVVQATPATWRLLLDGGWEGAPGLKVLCGGEALPRDLADRLGTRCGELWNLYGPTETTIWSTALRVGPGEGAPPIGAPIANTRVYLLDRGGEPVPVGVPGELCIGGEGVTRGYLGQPELTAERFVPDGFSGEPGARLYRTGDHARWRPDGKLAYLGRTDHQVKVRGFRIELAEIEAVLRVQERVREAVVVVRERAPGDPRLVGYVVAEGGAAVSAAELRRGLRERLPEYMVPAAFVALESFPLTPSGKLDRRELPAPAWEGEEEERVERRTALEEILCGIWAEVLGLERVGVRDGFFELGGHSLLATQAVSRVRRALGVELPLRALFEAPTAAELSARVQALQAASPGTAPPIQPVPHDAPLPLSFAQQRLWIVDRLDPGSPAYNLAAALRMRGSPDVGALRASLGELVRRHEALRTVFAEQGGTPVQLVRPPSPVPLPTLDLGALPDAGRERAAGRLAEAEAMRPFDLERGPLLRSTLLRLDEQDHVFCLTLHHIVGDGWSMDVLVRELSGLYDAFSRGEPSPLPGLPVQYADYAVWQRSRLGGDVLEAQVGFWKQALQGAPPLLEIPTDRPRTPDRGARAGSHRFSLPAETAQGLRSLARREGVTLFMSLLAGWQALLARWAAVEDVVVGTPVAGRTQVETEGLIGFFVNMLALRADLAGDPTWTEALRRVRDAALGAYAHQDLPFERLVEELAVERSLDRTPVFQAVFSLDRTGGRAAWLQPGGLALEPFGGSGGAARFDLDLAVADTGQALSGTLVYRAGLFEPETAARMGGHLAAVLEAMAADPGRRLSELSLLRGAERTQVLEAWNATATELPRACIHELFAQQAERTPDAAAVLFRDEVITYRELERRSGRLAQLLRGRGVGPEVRVGVCVDRGVEMVVGVLGILRAGGAYVPVEPANPGERLREVFADAGVSIVLTTAAGAHLPEEVAALRLDDPATAAALAATPDVPPPAPSDPRQLAYVVYTSGSTGRPKGVMVEHGSVVRLVRNTNYLPFGPGERIAQVSNPAFDAATFELWGALLNGGCLVVVERETSLSPARLAAELRERQVTSLFLTASLFNRIAHDEPDAFRTCRHVLVGGEAVDPQSMRRVLEAGGPERLLNGYGPTETTTFAAWHQVRQVEPGAQGVPIGQALSNTSLYVLDGAGEPVPIGLAGELYIGGKGVGRGYLGRPELTAERFVPDAFGAAGGRLYRTGDRVRWLPTGALEYLGRFDRQAKVRGFRIEPGEIESALLGVPRVREAVVMVRESRPGERHLVAYVAPEEGATVSGPGLRAALRARLPRYMVPDACVVLERLPLNANGKVDRQALPAPVWEAAGYVAPRTPAEEVLAGIWEETLGLERVGIEDGFFDLGGHSLLATQVVSRAREALGVELPLRALFEATTVAALAGRVAAEQRAGAAPAPPVERVHREAPPPLSFAQQRLWLMDRLEPGSAAYNMPSSVRLRGTLETAMLRASLDALVRRHEALRTVFAEQGGTPVQVIRPHVPVTLPVVDLGALAAEERESTAERLAEAEALRPFDLARGPLLRAQLLRLDERDHVLCFTLHHVVGDGWSMDVLMREVSALYAAACRGAPRPLPELPVQYADYAAWQRNRLTGAVLEEQLEYWRTQLGGMPPQLDIPTDSPRAARQSPRAGRHALALPAEAARGLRALARREGATLFMALLAAWQVLLGRYADQDDVVVGTPIAGRTRTELEGLIGFFVNMLPLRARLGGDPTWHEVLRRVREAALGAYAHQELPFERLVDELAVERSLTHTPLFQVTFALQASGAHERLSLGDVGLEPFGPGVRTAKFDLELTFAEDGDRLRGTLLFRSALFEAETVARMAGHLEVLLGAMAADPERRLSEVSMLHEAERAQVLEASRTPDDRRPPAALHEMFARQAERRPDAQAVVFGDQALSYADLERSSNRLAGSLRGRGVGPEVRVGICLERGIEMVVAVLGVLKAGGAYVPLDPTHPAERRAYTLSDAGAPFLISHSSLLETLPAFHGEVVCVDREAVAGGPDGPLPVEVGPHGAAYVIYTSGSTGRPKGVVVEHASLASFAHTVIETFGLTEDDAMLAQSNFAFDIWAFEVLVPLVAGASVRLASAEQARDAAALVRQLSEADAVHAVPALMRQVVSTVREREDGVLARVRHVFIGGDAIPPALLEEIRAAFPAARVWAMYGPTETTMISAATPLRRGASYGWQMVGRALPGVGLYVCDAGGGLLPLGVPGELWIGGAGVARGYLGRPELTAERFVPDPFSEEAGGRLYRTGDRVRRRPDGEPEFLGRNDQQVKIRGFRIEPGEVEAALLEHEAVHEAVVMVREDAPGQKRLVAYLVPEEGADISTPELKSRLQGRLPEYMVPGAFVVLPWLPLNVNGKVDRRALPAPQSGGGADYVAPTSEMEELLCRIWLDVLSSAGETRLDRVGIHDNFFELGGHSLLATQVVAQIHQVLGIEVPLEAVFEFPTVAGIVTTVEDRLILARNGSELTEHLSRLELLNDPDFGQS